MKTQQLSMTQFVSRMIVLYGLLMVAALYAKPSHAQEFVSPDGVGHQEITQTITKGTKDAAAVMNDMTVKADHQNHTYMETVDDYNSAATLYPQIQYGAVWSNHWGKVISAHLVTKVKAQKLYCVQMRNQVTIDLVALTEGTSVTELQQVQNLLLDGKPHDDSVTLFLTKTRHLASYYHDLAGDAAVAEKQLIALTSDCYGHPDDYGFQL